MHGTGAPLAALLAASPRDDERSWSDDPTRFGVLAVRLWTPLLRDEQVGKP